MKVLLVNGGPHPKGCTYTALQEVAITLQQNGIETEIMWLGNEPIAGCIACNYCKIEKRCFRQDCVNEFLDKLDTIDGFVFGSPVHFASASGALTSFLDRAFFGRNFDGKVGAAVLSCRRGGATASFDQINKYFAIKGIPIVTSQYWNMVHGNTPDEVRQDLEGMQTMRTLGKNMAWLIKCIYAGKAANINFPQKEPPITTNFIR